MAASSGDKKGNLLDSAVTAIGILATGVWIEPNAQTRTLNRVIVLLFAGGFLGFLLYVIISLSLFA